MGTFMAKASEVERQWYIVDVEGQTLGRVATKIASILAGKNKPVYTRHVDTGDHVIVINAAKVVLTGKKLDQKLYRHHSLHPGGLKEIKCKVLLEKYPERIIESAVKGMLPKNSLGRTMYKKLKVYRTDVHNNQAQKPIKLELND